jgi:hypothetical protein
MPSKADERIGDWRAIEALYTQLSLLKKREDSAPAPLSEVSHRLAEAIARVFASYQEHERAFLTHLCTTMSTIDGITGSERDRFRRLYKDLSLDRFDLYQTRDGRRLPKPFEAAVETVRRISDLNSVGKALEGLDTTAVLGGSLSYGRFFNTVGGGAGKPSDCDLIVVVRNYSALPKLVEALATACSREDGDFIEEASLETMAVQVEAFTNLIKQEPGRTMFQHKLNLWEDGTDSEYFKRTQLPLNYLLGLHVVSADDFEHIALKDQAAICDLGDGSKRMIQEYRTDPPPRDFEDQFCFAGLRRESALTSTPVGNGFLTDVQVCELHEDRFYPGTHLNLLLPQFDVRWESPQTAVRIELLALRWKLLARLDEERRLHPLEVQKLSLSHPRSPYFAARVTRRLDQD